MSERDNLYVAEIWVPVYLRGRPELRGGVPARIMGVHRGYWQMRYEEDHLGTSRPVGLTLTIEFEAAGRRDAETAALLSSQRFQEVAAFFSGSPLRACKLQKLGAVDAYGSLKEQHNYFYDEVEPSGTPFNVSALRRLFDRIEVVDPGRADRIRTAIRWQALAVGAPDPAIRFTALWFGLEAIGPVLDARFHETGPRAPCVVCENEAGKDRNRGLAGINHLLRRVAEEIQESAEELKALRDRIAHCLRPVDELERDAHRLAPDVEATLTSGILSAVAVEGEGPGSWETALPKDYTTRPGERASLYFPAPLLEYRPWVGRWLELARTKEDEHSRCSDDGKYYYSFASAFTTDFTAPGPGFEPRKEYVIYERDGIEVDPSVSGLDAEHPAVERWEELSPVRDRIIREQISPS